MSYSPYSQEPEPDSVSDPALIGPAGKLSRLWSQALAISTPEYWRNAGQYQVAAAVVAVVLLFFWLISVYWSFEPASFDVRAVAEARTDPAQMSRGYVSASTLLHLTETLRDKPGGYIANDWLPPGGLMDDMPAWERGVLEQIEDFTTLMHRAWSEGDDDIKVAWESFAEDSWFSSAESRQADGIAALELYLQRLGAPPDERDAEFTAHNLHKWLALAGKRLDTLARELGATVVGTHDKDEAPRTTPWLEIDNAFYRARGSAWALLHLMRAVQIDFAESLDKHKLTPRADEIVRVLEATQKGVWSPVILSGYEFGLFANHSLVMASYIARAAQGIETLEKGLAAAEK